MANDNHGKKQMNKGDLCRRGKGVPIVDVKDLSIAFRYQVSFELANIAIRSNFHFINPATTNNSLLRRQGNQLLRVTGL